jgi:hypothetical protein
MFTVTFTKGGKMGVHKTRPEIYGRIGIIG